MLIFKISAQLFFWMFLVFLKKESELEMWRGSENTSQVNTSKSFGTDKSQTSQSI